MQLNYPYLGFNINISIELIYFFYMTKNTGVYYGKDCIYDKRKN